MKILLKVLFSILICIPLTGSALQSDVPLVCGYENSGIQQASVYSNLNFGLYWFKDQVINQTPTSYCNQNQNNGDYFDPKKKHTLIFVHGWAIGSVEKSTRFNFNALSLQVYPNVGTPNITDLVAPWLEGKNGDLQPWNVGMFYWNQLADEQDLQTAEAKIWRTDGPDNMRWLDNQGNLNNPDPTIINKSVSEMFADQYIAALSNYVIQNPTADIRLVGESLGAQLVIHTAKLVADRVAASQGALPTNLIPKQIVLLDPMATKDGDDETRLHTLIQDVLYLENTYGVIVSSYRTSSLYMLMPSLLSDTTPLLKYTAFSDLTPCIYDPSVDAKYYQAQHTFGIWWYLLSYTLTSNPITGSPNESAPFANTPDSDLRTFMNDPGVKFVSDNDFNVKNKLCDNSSTAIDKEWSKWQMQKLPNGKDLPRPS